MSAIFGIIHLNDQLVDIDHLACMSRSLAGYGRGGNGIWTDGDKIGMGCHLQQFTPEDQFDQQPLLSACRQKVLVCSARIDNTPELSILLDIPVQATPRIPDSVYILEAYLRWGCDCVNRIIGDYAFALWDISEQKLHLARSPAGGRPLFYYSSSNIVVFSTSPKGLFANPHVPRKLDLKRIADFLTWAPVESGTAFFQDINRLSAGHLLTVHRKEVHLRNFWQPNRMPELRFKKDDEYVDAFLCLYDRVVSDHLRSATPVGVMMSGGLDSTSVAAVAAAKYEQEGKRLATFTEVPRADFAGQLVTGKYADETTLVKAMAKHYANLDLNLVNTENRLYLDDFESFFDVANMPFHSPTNRVWYEAILQAANAKDIRVLLAGFNGNRTVSRDGSGLLSALMRSGKWWRAFTEARALHEDSVIRALVGQGVMPLLPKLLYVLIQNIRRGHLTAARSEPWADYSAINPDFARSQHVAERARKKGFDFLFRMNSDVREGYCKMIPKVTAKLNDINHAYRQIYGLDIRDPTSDVRLVEFCLSLPEEQYLQGGVSRRLIRRAMVDKVPIEILNNKQRGLQAADWFESLLASREKLLLDLATWSKHDLLPEVLDLQRMTRLLRDMPSAQNDAAKMFKDYRLLLEYGLMMGRFILWFEQGTAVSA